MLLFSARNSIAEKTSAYAVQPRTRSPNVRNANQKATISSGSPMVIDGPLRHLRTPHSVSPTQTVTRTATPHGGASSPLNTTKNPMTR